MTGKSGCQGVCINVAGAAGSIYNSGMITPEKAGAGRVPALAVLVVGGWLGFLPPLQAADPVVSNVRAAQRPGTQWVEIAYDVADADGDKLTVSVAVSDTGGASYSLPATSFTGDVGPNVSPGPGKRIVWDAGKDWPGKFSANMRFRVTADDAGVPPPAGMALIPAGSFTMGDSLSEGWSDELPLHTVSVSAFYMDKYDVTKALWDEVYTWALGHGYGFDNAGAGKAASHPVQTVTWYDAVKWCNARSEKEGRVPAYYTSGAQTTVYRTGQGDVQNDWVKWTAGYRLPTEAEWEKAARGGLSGQRFPWGSTISWSQANYYSSWKNGKPYFAYDVNPTEGYNPAYATGDFPFTSPVGSFAPNGYGLYDLAGNVWEWCWDRYGAYPSGSQTDPRGPARGLHRVDRGGGWLDYAFHCRTAYRNGNIPTYRYDALGFRSVLPSGQ